MYENCTKLLCFFTQFPFFLHLDFLAHFSKLKKSANLLKIRPQVYFIKKIEILALKLLFFEIFCRRKISHKIEMKKNENCVKMHKNSMKFSCF